MTESTLFFSSGIPRLNIYPDIRIARLYRQNKNDAPYVIRMIDNIYFLHVNIINIHKAAMPVQPRRDKNMFISLRQEQSFSNNN